MRKTVAILLMVSLFVFESGYMILSFFRYREIKEEMAVYISDHPNEQGTVFSFRLNNGKVSEAGFKWESGTDEFSYAGKMYDVIRLKQEKDKLVIHAISDQQEDQLMSAITRHHRQKQKPSLLQLVSLVFILQAEQYQLTYPFTTSPVYTDHHASGLNVPALEILSPPPERV